MRGELGRTRGGRTAGLLLAGSAAASGAAVLGIFIFLAILSMPVLEGAVRVFTWDWRPFHGHHGILPMVAGSLILASCAMLLALPMALGITAFAHGSGYSLLSAVVVLSVLVLPTIVLVVHAHDVDVAWLRRRVAMVLQMPNVLPVSIEKNMLLPLKLAADVSGTAARERMEEALANAELLDEVKDRLGAHAATLSGGQQQRLCLARALALDRRSCCSTSRRRRSTCARRSGSRA